ncbi:unnamed protein product [Rhizophagus irregularis]|nr:unnamed protein product [Rhizophagus irregularis]
MGILKDRGFPDDSRTVCGFFFLNGISNFLILWKKGPSACSNFGSWILIGKFGTEGMIGVFKRFGQPPGLGILENGSVSGNMEIRIMASDFELWMVMGKFRNEMLQNFDRLSRHRLGALIYKNGIIVFEYSKYRFTLDK